MTRGWTPAEATGFLLDRELFGMRFQLDRIKRLLLALGSPQDSFLPIHVVGTNGKTSTTRFAAAILAAAGKRSGAYVSPHLTGFHERVLLPSGDGPAESSPELFAAAVGRVAGAARAVERGLPEGERATQFELVTAAGFLLLAEFGVEIAAIEAGLGGRWDATNVLRSPKTVVLTSIGQDHTRWLGSEPAAIAAEKLAVAGKGDLLVRPDSLPREVAGQIAAAEQVAGRRSVEVRTAALNLPDLAALGDFQRDNFAIALTAAEHAGGPIPAVAARVAAATAIPGRMTVIGNQPLTIVDAAHNVDGAERLAAALPAVVGGRSTVAAIGMLDDKDAAGFVNALAPALAGLVATEPANPRAMSAAAIASLATEAGFGSQMITIARPAAEAVAEAARLAGESGAVLVAGSVHLAGDILSPQGERVVSAL